MSEHVAGMIADCEAKIGQLTAIVEKLRWFQREFPHAAAAVTVAEEKPRRMYTRRAGKAKRHIKQTNKQTNKARRGPVSRAPRSLPDGAESQLAAIVDALRKRPTPLSPGELCAQLKLSKFTLRKRVDVLVARGTVTRSGTGPRNQLIHLQSGAGRASAPAPKQESPASSALDQVEIRDRLVLGKIREAGPKGLSLRELGILTGETEASISSALTRLRVKKQIAADDNGKWITA